MCFDRNINGNRDVEFFEWDYWSLHWRKKFTLAINYFNQIFYYRSTQWSMSTPRIILIVTMSMCYGMELTYKLATKQLIFIINPCHVMCLLQLTVLCLNPFSSGAQHLFRIMLNGMFFPLCACIFPVTNSLFLPGEVFTFWLEHILLLVIPLFLLYENQLKPEPLSDFSYALSLYGYYYIYILIIKM